MSTDCLVKLLDVVALTFDATEKGLVCGQVGTVVEMLGPSVFEVEFSDDEGRAYARGAFSGSELMVLRFEPVIWA